jgi:hypothetical protein
VVLHFAALRSARLIRDRRVRAGHARPRVSAVRLGGDGRSKRLIVTGRLLPPVTGQPQTGG